MFEPSGLGKTIFDQRYAIDGESWQEACQRVATHVATAEHPAKQEDIAARFYDALSEGHFMPGGRIWANAGRQKAQLLNCFVLPTGDSREAWGQSLSDTIIVSGMGGGVGINTSSIRPRGAAIKGTGGHATGPVSLMQMLDSVGDVLRTGGGRRLALMLALEVDHPDTPEFLDRKLDQSELNNANVSVILNMPTEVFIKNVKEDQPIRWMFNGMDADGPSMTYGALWERIVHNAWKSGEPGVLNGFLANADSNIWYHKPLICTNPCGEIWLEEYGCCDLGALVLPSFVQEGEFNWPLFLQTIQTSVRFLDNVLDVNHYPLEAIKQNCLNVRRIGLGVMGLHTMLLDLGMKYSSPEALNFVDRLFYNLKVEAYKTSSRLAEEKGSFPAYKNEEFRNSGFMQKNRDIGEFIDQIGMRNCAVLTVAPTGTTGMVHGCSTGIEPLFAPVYYRRWWVDEKRHKELVITDEFKKYGVIAEGAYDVSPRQHFEMQKVVQNHVDNAVSKTINLPEDYPLEDLAALWLEYLPYLKGSTFYREGSRGEEPLEPIRGDAIELIQHMAAATTGDPTDQYAMDCPGGSCTV